MTCAVLGVPYDFNVDLWSTAVTLYELSTGRILFPGKTNNEMLRLMMETRGRIPNRVIRRGTLRNEHFDEQCNFLYHEVDKITGKVRDFLICNLFNYRADLIVRSVIHAHLDALVLARHMHVSLDDASRVSLLFGGR